MNRVLPSTWPSFVALLALVMGVMGCAGGLTGSKEEKLTYFDRLESETLARLVTEHPTTKEELTQSVGYVVGEKKVVKIPLVGWGGGAGVVVDKTTGKRSYVRIPELQFGMGWGGRDERIVLIFQDREKLLDLADGKWKGSVGVEAAAKAGDVGAAGGVGSGGLAKKGYSTYVLTEAGVSATATIAVLRVQPYSIE